MGRFRLIPRPEAVVDMDTALAAVEYLRTRPLLAVDTETTGLRRPVDRTIILAISDGVRRFAIWPEVALVFQDLLEDPEKTLIMHNANFDCWMLYNIGIHVYRKSPRDRYRVVDTMILHHVLNSEAGHGLKELAKLFLGIDMISFKKTFNTSSSSEFEATFLDLNNVDTTAAYASLDAYATFHLYKKLRRELIQVPSEFGTMWDYYTQYEMKLTKVLWYMELGGVRVDRDRLLAMAPVLESKLVEVQRWYAKNTGSLLINLNSPAQLNSIFFGKLKRKPVSFTDTGAPQLTAAILEAWADDGCEFSQQLLEYKETSKQLNTYVLGAMGLLTPESRIHTTFKQMVAKTGRLSSTDPNLQNQNPIIREAYVADEGGRLRASDYAQLEMRVLAHRSGDANLVNPIRAGKDLHSATAAVMFDIAYEAVHGAQLRKDAGDQKLAGDVELLGMRSGAKTINFGLLYGQGARKLAKTLGVPLKRAEELMSAYFKALPGVNAYLKEEIARARELGYCTTHLGRRRYLSGYQSLERGDVASAERKTKNTPIQGTAAELVGSAMIKLFESRVLMDYQVSQRIQVHDEVVFAMPAEVEHEPVVNRVIDDCMAHPFSKDLLVPLETSTKYGDNWLQCK